MKLGQLDDQFITTKEIIELMRTTINKLRVIRNSQFSNMPKPVNDNAKYFIYMRDEILVWIEYWQFISSDIKPILDNKMAGEFLWRL
jgi:hypothetical protein